MLFALTMIPPLPGGGVLPVELFFIWTLRTILLATLRHRKMTFIGTVFHSTRRRPTASCFDRHSPGNRARHSLRDANLSVLIRNSAKREMKLTPPLILPLLVFISSYTSFLRISTCSLFQSYLVYVYYYNTQN